MRCYAVKVKKTTTRSQIQSKIEIKITERKKADRQFGRSVVLVYARVLDFFVCKPNKKNANSCISTAAEKKTDVSCFFAPRLHELLLSISNEGKKKQIEE